jgi:hypothetical protein
MKFRLFAAIAVLAVSTVAAHAQAAIYFNPVITRVSNSTPDVGPFAFLGQNSTSQMFYGVNLGGYYTFYQNGKTEVALDVRDTIQHGNNASLNLFLVGVKVQTAPFKRPIKPYIQISGGAGTTKAPTNPTHVTKGTFGAFAGIDYTLKRHIDFRVIEVGYTSLTTVSRATVGGNATVPSANLLSFGTGVVFRF